MIAHADIDTAGRYSDAGSEVEFFGIKIRVKDARLAALLNSDVTDDVVVVVKRTVGSVDDES